MTNWRATYARRFRRVAIERPLAAPKTWAEWTNEEIAELPTELQRNMAHMSRGIGLALINMQLARTHQQHP